MPSSLADLAHLFDTVKAAKGRIDVLFANAGIYEFTPFGTITEDAYDKMFDINVKGVLFTVQQAVPLMADGGSIILTGSVAGSKGFEADTVYGATKAAIRSFARTWTADLKAKNIRVNVLESRSDPDARVSMCSPMRTSEDYMNRSSRSGGIGTVR